eukprot:scaffold8469_cov179-Ochromonas_danica.AAC.3
MSVIWCLPRDILHTVYGEWLKWKDLSTLDVACVEKNEREDWLTSLTRLRLSTLDPYISEKNMRIFIKWLVSRKVFFVENFPVGVDDALEDIMTMLDMKSYCPALQSVEITRLIMNQHSSDLTEIENNLSIFLSHCHNLQGITINVDKIDRYYEHLTDIVLSVLVKELTENSLVKISLKSYSTKNRHPERHHDINVMITNLLRKHASSLRQLNITTSQYISGIYEEDMDFIVSTLIENQICLKVLGTSQAMPSLISYLSSSGGLLEVLEVSNTQMSFDAEDLVVSVAASCPKLTRLVILRCKPCSIETLRRLYEQCPHLQDGTIDGIIETDEKRKLVSIEVKGHNEDWAICLSHALRRRQYKKVTLRLSEGYYHPRGNLKSMLEPYHIELDVSITSESSLISLLQDLPHVNSLHLLPTVNNQYTDATLAAISDHANSLTDLDLKTVHFSDRSLSELIKACQLLKTLTIDYCGWESLEAISKLSNLNIVDLSVAENVPEELLDGLLLSKEMKWPSTLEEGFIKIYEDEFYYEFAEYLSYHWIKRVSD